MNKGHGWIVNQDYLPPNSEVSKEGSGYFTSFITFEVVVEGGGAVVVVVVVVGSEIRLLLLGQ